MNRAEELARQARERADACRKEAHKKPVVSESSGIINAQSAGDIPGKGCGATPEQWPDGACGCGV